MDIYYHKNYTAASHDFDTTRKSAFIAERIGEDNLHSPDYFLGLSNFLIEKYHDGKYVLSLRNGKDRELAESNGFGWCPNIWRMVRYNTAGVLAAAESAIANNSIAGSLSSGLHHAYYDHGAGFCTVNSLAIAAFNALKGDRYSHKKVLILDFDAHNGGGTYDMIVRNGFDRSVHQIDLSTNTYDMYDGDSNHVVHIADSSNYLDKVREILKAVNPKEYCLVLYNAGVDPFPEIDHETLKLRDQMVFEECIVNNVPCAFVLAGGYTDEQSMEQLVESHMNTINAAKMAQQKHGTMNNYSGEQYKEIINQMDELNPEALFADGLRDAIVGYTRILDTGKEVVVYDAYKVIEVLMRDEGMTYEDAVEYADFNIFTAYMGENTPLFVWEFCT